MKYIVLLRGINISGKNKIEMSRLKEELLKIDSFNVKTYLNSGNIILDSNSKKDFLESSITKMIKEKFNLDIPVFILTTNELDEIMKNVPTDFLNKSEKIYYNIIFLKNITYQEMLKEIGEPSEYNKITNYKNVIYWSFDLNNYRKSNWWVKTASCYVKDYITIRTFNTIKKIYLESLL